MSTGCATSSLPLIDDMAPVRSFFLAVEYPMTTTSSMGFSVESAGVEVAAGVLFWACAASVNVAMNPNNKGDFFMGYFRFYGCCQFEFGNLYNCQLYNNYFD